MSQLDANSPVAQWVAEYPHTASLFDQLKIDYCCGGGIALQEACDRMQLNANTIIAQLWAVPEPATTENWLQAPLADLCDHIEGTHHAYLREELPRLSALLDKVIEAHAANHPELPELGRVFAALRAELEPHMFKEERILFPAIRQTEAAASCPDFPFGSVANPIRMMEHEHRVAGRALTRIRELTREFLPPDDACNTYRFLLDALQRLEGDLHQHIHKENNILFPRAIQLESSSSGLDA